MKFAWPGHSGFRLEIAGQILLVDPWFRGDPVFPQDRRNAAIEGATAVPVSRAHGDHATDAPGIATEPKGPAVGACDLMSW